LLKQFAWVAVKDMPPMTVSAERSELMLQYKRYIKLFTDGTLPYTHGWVTAPPVLLATMDSDAVLQMFLQSTGKTTSVMSESALYLKVKLDVQQVYRFMLDWCKMCPSDCRLPGHLYPALLPSGTNRDEVYARIVGSWRSAAADESGCVAAAEDRPSQARYHELEWCFKSVMVIVLLCTLSYCHQVLFTVRHERTRGCGFFLWQKRRTCCQNCFYNTHPAAATSCWAHERCLPALFGTLFQN
jgi:hypothetical protein